MNLINPFQKKPDEQRQINQQRQYERDNIVTEQATHPQAYDEQYHMEKQALLNEIRRWQQDLEPKYQRFFEDLAGIRLTESGDVVNIPNIKPFTNLNGAYHITNYLRRIDVNVMRSNYSEFRIYSNLNILLATLIQLIKDKREEWDIEKKQGVLDYIWTNCYNAMEPTYLHGLNDGERRHESEIHKIIETKNVLPKEEKRGLFQK